MNPKLPGLVGCKVRPMTEDESKMFISLTLEEMRDEKALGLMDRDLREKQVFPYMVLTKRLEAFKKHFSPTLDIGIAPQIFCAMLSNSPGKAVMWAHTLNELHIKLGRKVTLGDWTSAFPMGIPTDEEYERVWDMQKVVPDLDKGRGDNMIDDFEQWSKPTKPT